MSFFISTRVSRPCFCPRVMSSRSLWAEGVGEGSGKGVGKGWARGGRVKGGLIPPSICIFSQ